MLNYIQGNIDYAQGQAKQKLSLVLDDMGYKLVNDIHNTAGVETRIFQWMNTEKKHCIQLIWDGKEDWFDLGEFIYTGDFNFQYAQQLMHLPLKRTKWFNRKNYIDKKVDKLIEVIIKRK